MHKDLARRDRERTEAGVEALEEALTLGSETTQLRMIQEILPPLIAVSERTIDELETLDRPPSTPTTMRAFCRGSARSSGCPGEIVDAAAATILAPVAIAVVDETRRSLTALDPPSELAGDHARLLDYLDELPALQEEIAAGAKAADAAAIRGGIAATVLTFCRAAADVSPASQPALGFFFDPPGQQRPPPAGERDRRDRRDRPSETRA